MWPPRVSVGSSQWSASGRPVIALYSSARRISPAVDDRPAVVGERGGARVGELAHLGQLRRRAGRIVIAAMKPTGTSASRSARARRPRSTSAMSTTGSVFGIARIAQ